jgi:RNase P subunit RPR2
VTTTTLAETVCADCAQPLQDTDDVAVRMTFEGGTEMLCARCYAITQALQQLDALEVGQ